MNNYRGRVPPLSSLSYVNGAPGQWNRAESKHLFILIFLPNTKMIVKILPLYRLTWMKGPKHWVSTAATTTKETHTFTCFLRKDNTTSDILPTKSNRSPTSLWAPLQAKRQAEQHAERHCEYTASNVRRVENSKSSPTEIVKEWKGWEENV